PFEAGFHATRHALLKRTEIQSRRTSMTEPEAAEPYRPLYRNYVLFVLFLGYVINALDRAIIGTLMPAIKAEFALSYTQLGLLGGLAFALFYATCGIPIATL